MDHQLAKLIGERVAAGLQRKSVTSCSRWAEKYRVLGPPFPGKWNFKYYPWLKDMHDSEAELNVGMKSSQVGFTETVLNKAFFSIDVKGVDVLYVLPSEKPDASDFSSGRFDPALELSPHLASLFSNVKNVGHKRAGSTNLYIRGSRARGGLKSIPVGLVVIDELDECTQKNIALALERTSGQKQFEQWMISTPTIESTGIHAQFLDSSQNHFIFKCPHCSRFTELSFPESLVITAENFDDPSLKDSHLICKECKAKLDHENKHVWLASGSWVPGIAGRDTKGWHINRMYSSAAKATPHRIAEQYIKSQSDKFIEQEFFNSTLGKPHAVDGAQLTDTEINACIADYINGHRLGDRYVTMGVDQGSWIHYEIDEWVLPQYNSGADVNIFSQCRVAKFGKVRNFEDLDLLMYEYGISFCVLDAQPERRKALEFANRFYGRVRLCWYPNGISGKMLHVNETEQSVSVDRTSWLDLSLGRFRRGKPWIMVPKNIDTEYRTNLKALVRHYGTDRNGNPIGQYIKKDKDADHYAHARNYAEIALPLALGLGKASDITQSVV